MTFCVLWNKFSKYSVFVSTVNAVFNPIAKTFMLVLAGLFGISLSKKKTVLVRFCYSFHSPTPAALSPSVLLTFRTMRSVSSSRDLPRSSRRSGCWRRRYDVLTLIVVSCYQEKLNSCGTAQVCSTAPNLHPASSAVCSIGGCKC